MSSSDSSIVDSPPEASGVIPVASTVDLIQHDIPSSSQVNLEKQTEYASSSHSEEYNKPVDIPMQSINEGKKEDITPSLPVGEYIIDGNEEEEYVPKYQSDSPPLQLEWKDLTYKVKVPLHVPANLSLTEKLGFKAKNMFKKKEKTVLYEMSGFVKPGNTLAIMGPSGAGKTSLCK